MLLKSLKQEWGVGAVGRKGKTKLWDTTKCQYLNISSNIKRPEIQSQHRCLSVERDIEQKVPNTVRLAPSIGGHTTHKYKSFGQRASF